MTKPLAAQKMMGLAMWVCCPTVSLDLGLRPCVARRTKTLSTHAKQIEFSVNPVRSELVLPLSNSIWYESITGEYDEVLKASYSDIGGRHGAVEKEKSTVKGFISAIFAVKVGM